MMKHQSMVRINNVFISKLKSNYSKVSVGTYIIERMIDMGINRGHLYNIYKEQGPFYDDILKYRANFSISTTPIQTFSTKNSNYKNDISALEFSYKSPNTPLNKNQSSKFILFSFVKKNIEQNTKYFGNNICNNDHYYKIDSSTRFPIIMEYMVDRSQLRPVHIEIDNNVLISEVDLDDVGYYPKKPMLFTKVN